MKLLVDNYVKIYSEDMCVVDLNGGLYFEFVMPESIGRGCGLYSENRILAVMENDAMKAGIVIDWDNSLFVGDRPKDEQCAKNVNIQFKYIDQFLQDN